MAQTVYAQMDKQKLKNNEEKIKENIFSSNL
jgi:hypothetical protein